MKRLSLLLLVCLIPSLVSAGNTVTLQPVEASAVDAYINSSTPTSNFETSNYLHVGEGNHVAGQISRSLVKFDFSILSSAAILESATLNLYCVDDYSSNARTFSVYRSSRSWIEGQVTWNQYSTGNNWSTAGGMGAGDYDSSAIGSRAFSATETVNEFKNFPLTSKYRVDLGSNGWIIAAATESDDAYAFSSSNFSNPPKLTYSYRLLDSVQAQ